MRWLLFALLPLPALAETCPPGPDQSEALEAIYSDLAVAPDEMAARMLSGRLWQLWTKAPDGRAQVMLDSGMAARERGQLSGSVAVLSRLVEYCPDYAEGWNQRAFALFLAGDLGRALPDLDRALELNPRHLGALTGRAMTLIGLGRIEDGHADLRRALELNRWLSERALLPGRDI